MRERAERPSGGPAGAIKALHEDRRGAVVVEFAVAMWPLFMTFFCTLQVMHLAQARLVIKHATIMGARAGAVFANTAGVTPDQPQGLNQDKIEAAVKGSVGKYTRSIDFKVDVQDNATCSDPYGPITVKVEATVKCEVAMGKMICLAPGFQGGMDGTSVVFKDEVTMPHQGAKYKGPQSGGTCGN